MAVSNQTDKIYGAGNGVTQTFSFPFKIFDSSQILAYLINTSSGIVTGPLTLTTDYSISINAVTEGGTITFVVAPPTGSNWFIKRLVPYTQAAVIPTEGPLPGLQISNQLDLMTMMVIQDQEAVSRCLQLPTTYTGTLPIYVPTPQAGLALGWDPNTLQLVNLMVTAVGTIAVPISNANLSPLTVANLVKGSALYSLASIVAGAGVIPIANIPTGTTVGTVPVLDANGKVAYANLNYFPVVKLSNTQSSGTNGGTATSGSWLTLPVNTKDRDASAICTLNTNQITLPAGTYRVKATQQFYDVGSCQIRLYNSTDSTIVSTGSTGFAQQTTTASGGVSQIDDIITIAAGKTLVFQYQVTTTEATNGLGLAASFGSEVFGIFVFEKIS